MTADRKTPDNEDDSLGVLEDAGTVDTTAIGILGDATAQVAVALPAEDEDLSDDDVVADDEYEGLVLEEDPAALLAVPDDVGRIHEASSIADIVIEIPADADLPVQQPEPLEAVIDDESEADAAEPEAVTEDVIELVEEVVGVTEEDEEIVHDVAAHTIADEDNDFADVSFSDLLTAYAADGSLPEPVAERDVEPEAEPVAKVEPAGEEVAVIIESVAAETEDAMTEPNKRLTHPEPARAVALTEPTPAAKRLGELGEQHRESADLLTADRLLDPNQMTKAEPEGTWSHFVYTLSGRRINLGDGKKARERKELSARIAAPLAGGARFVPVLSRKGGVGKTTITTLLGMALADAREDRVIAIDANPDRGTLAERIVKHNGKTVRDLVRIHDEVKGFHDLSAVVSRDATRLDVLASDTDPRVSEAFSDTDYENVASVAAHYYSIVLTDTGTGIVHSVMGATLAQADHLVIVTGLSVDEARLASETLTWLETNGYAEQAREAIVVLNQSTAGAPLVRLDELQAHFATRVKHVVRMPYDPQIASGSAITFANLLPETRIAARELAALVVENLRAKAA